MQDSVLPQGCGGGVAPTSSHHPIYPFSPFYPFKISSKSLTQVCHFWGIFSVFSPVENFFELSTSYQQCAFFNAVFGKFFV